MRYRFFDGRVTIDVDGELGVGNSLLVTCPAAEAVAGHAATTPVEFDLKDILSESELLAQIRVKWPAANPVS